MNQKIQFYLYFNKEGVTFNDPKVKTSFSTISFNSWLKFNSKFTQKSIKCQEGRNRMMLIIRDNAKKKIFSYGNYTLKEKEKVANKHS